MFALPRLITFAKWRTTMHLRMAPRLAIQQNMKDQQPRVIHAEHESITCGKIGRGEPRWARAVSWFRRPNDVKMEKRKSKPVSNLGEIAKFYRRGSCVKHNPSSVVIPSDTKVEQVMPHIDKVFSIQKDYWSHLGVALVAPTKPKAAKEKLVAVMEYGHKTAGHSVTMTPEQAAIYKRKTRRAGYGTCLKFSPKV